MHLHYSVGDLCHKIGNIGIATLKDASMDVVAKSSWPFDLIRHASYNRPANTS